LAEIRKSRGKPYLGMTREALEIALDQESENSNRKQAAGRTRAIKAALARTHIDPSAEWVTVHPDDWEPPGKPDAVMRLLSRTFGDRWRTLFGYSRSGWKVELQRRAGQAADWDVALDEIARSEFQIWRRTLAQRTVDAQRPGESGWWLAAGRVAASVVDGWHDLTKVDGHASDWPEFLPGTSERVQFVSDLRKAIYETTAPLRSRRDKWGRPIIRPRRRDPQLAAHIQEAALAEIQKRQG
jgi:hypothetical protein